MSEENLTASQQEALEKAWNILKEYFEHVIVVFDTEVPEGTDRVFDCNYHGGITAAIGLAERAKGKFLFESRNVDEG